MVTRANRWIEADDAELGIYYVCAGCGVYSLCPDAAIRDDEHHCEKTPPRDLSTSEALLAVALGIVFGIALTSLLLRQLDAANLPTGRPTLEDAR